MAVSLGNITGGAQTGFSTPGYNVAVDNPPDADIGKQWYVSGLTGTQAGVTAHSISSPFTITFEKPKWLATLNALLNAVTGIYGKVPENMYTVRVRKGVSIAANNVPRVMIVDMKIRVPAGADSYDPSNVRACMSAVVGALNQVSAGLGDTTTTGSLG